MSNRKWKIFGTRKVSETVKIDPKGMSTLIYSILVMSSVTYAIKAQGILAREGIGTRLEKLSKTQTSKGCGYGLRIEKSKVPEAVSVLKTEKIRIMEIVEY